MSGKRARCIAAGEIDDDGFLELVASGDPFRWLLQHHGHGYDDELAGRGFGHAASGLCRDPATYRERGQIAYHTGKRIVEMVWEDLRPSDIMTREAFENAIVLNSAIGGSTNAPIHLNAVARHLGVELDNDDWQEAWPQDTAAGEPEPAGEYLGEDYHRAGGVPAVVGELMRRKNSAAPRRDDGQRPQHGRELPTAEIIANPM